MPAEAKKVLPEKEQWAEIIAEALQAGLEARPGPVQGARLRPLVKRVAEARGLTFPPESEPTLRFHELLMRYPEVVTVLRRPRQDLLAVPANRAELLASASEPLFIRKDLFNAFTIIAAARKPWYNKVEDRVVWLDNGVDPQSPEMITVPPATAASELAVRHEFIGQLDNAMAKVPLETSLTEARPLTSFSRAVHSAYLRHSWHAFRSQRVLQSIREWAAKSNVQWAESWLVPKAGAALSSPRGSLERGASSADLAKVLGSLSQEDLTRINVPLDIVAKLLKRA